MENVNGLNKIDVNEGDVQPGKNALDESSVTMLDVLEEEKELEDEYAAVLGASDDKVCTYSQGDAVKRQALYSCLTCCPESLNDLTKCAGICLACTYQCHENHELVELYTKRNFRCDCPTERMGSSNKCRLNPGLDQPAVVNQDNVYNQNFQGLYCNCHRPYPDPERTAEEIMLQCAICEDWFHLHHLDGPPNAQKLMEACSEMICGSCMASHEFLRHYTGFALKAVDSIDDSVVDGNATVAAVDLSACEDNDNKLKSDLDKSISEIMNMGEGEATLNDAIEGEPSSKRAKLENDEIEKNEAKQKNMCRRPSDIGDYEKGPTFWGADWRNALCRCASCMQVYRGEKVEYLLDAEDSAKSYEERGKQKAAAESSYEQGIRALASIDRVQQIDVITEYNRMKDRLKDYLQTFVANKKVVTEDDINRFFSEIRNEKNVEIGLPHFCR
ncbi:putative E3 ubiquitin-protein ligase UBR7 [Stomoxys calcitrans]|uniref:UBR-type domain-containing protein n=1 Tax=Stomoxys calcitrans TaxID=35570 RepID=A0A1I8NLP7_STOCA|nr:putative E3 ubiquitin-protein ligase UBR7 [Stomoxys calcitrans]